MFTPAQLQVYRLNLKQLRLLCDEYLNDLNLDMNIFTREGGKHFLVHVVDEINDYELWKTEEYGLLSDPERCSVSEALRDYLSVIAWKNGIPKGDYLVSIFW